MEIVLILTGIISLGIALGILWLTLRSVPECTCPESGVDEGCPVHGGAAGGG